MSELKNTTAAEAVADAIARLNDTYDESVNRMTHARDRAIADLKTRESALGEVNGLIERARHAYVKDHAIYPGHDIVLSDTRLELNNGQHVRMVESPPWSGDRRQGPALTAGKTYRFWLLIEEVPDAGS